MTSGPPARAWRCPSDSGEAHQPARPAGVVERRALPAIPRDGADGRLSDAELAGGVVRAGMVVFDQLGTKAKLRLLRAELGSLADARDALERMERIKALVVS